MAKTESARHLGDADLGTMLLNSMRFTLDLARHHLQRSESRGLDSETPRHPKAVPAVWRAVLPKHGSLGRSAPRLKPWVRCSVHELSLRALVVLASGPRTNPTFDGAI